MSWRSKMFQFDRWHIFCKAIAVKVANGRTRYSIEKNKNTTNGITPRNAGLDDDLDVARRMMLGLLGVGIALIITANSNQKEFPLFMRAAAEVPIAISIWTFWTASNRFRGQSNNQRPSNILSNSLRDVIAGIQILGAVATGLFILHL